MRCDCQGTIPLAVLRLGSQVELNYRVSGEVKVDEHSNEITAIPELLRILDINGLR